MTNETVPVQTALGEAGACPKIEWQGKTYTVGHPTQKAKALFEDGIVESEKRGLDSLLARRLITAAKYDERLESLGKKIDRREHAAGGALWMQYAVGSDAESGAGTMLFFWSLIAQHHDGFTLDDCRQMAEESAASVKLALRRVVPAFFQAVGEVLRLPPEAMEALRAAVAAQLDRLLPTGSTP